MNYKDVDYIKYLSIDNGNGILLSKSDIDVLNRYGFDFNFYSSIKQLIVDIDSYCDDYYIEEDLEEILQKLNEIYYYNYVKK